MLLCVLFLACGGSPTVNVVATTLGDVPAPGGLQATADTEIGRRVQTCYQAALKTQGDLSGQVEFDVVGSHGILRPEEIGEAPQALSACVLEALSDSRLQRTLGDGPNEIGFALTVSFSP